MVSASANSSTKKRKETAEEGPRKGRVKSCVNCRTRKLRCSREERCDQCVKYKLECIWDDGAPSRTEEDVKLEASQIEVLRLNRIVLGLEERLARLELQQGHTSTSPASPSTPVSASSNSSLRSAFDSVSLGPRRGSIHTCSQGSVVSSLDPVDRASNPMIYPQYPSFPTPPPTLVHFSQPPPAGIPYFPPQPPSAESLPPSLTLSSSSSSIYSASEMPPPPASAPSTDPLAMWTTLFPSEPSAQGIPPVQEQFYEQRKGASYL
ncbi:hypothetical protein BCR35DRAFT_333567 [Leucosporidium creatinivorum]|uniref:Zn(2)-C6 fungal-type domain-containing protein n=1 Tax=Leucosporidium creatinivorum TaxID=106004 RepID=A0A1Y2ESN3_9BASI|nr:hypothetical protein BCR35DRAFT_333567 [Leucosporidium creatinivorum]